MTGIQIWAQIGPNWTNMGLFHIRFENILAKCSEIWSGKKVPDLTHLGPIWLTFHPTLPPWPDWTSRSSGDDVAIYVFKWEFLCNTSRPAYWRNNDVAVFVLFIIYRTKLCWLRVIDQVTDSAIWNDSLYSKVIQCPSLWHLNFELITAQETFI